MEKIILCVKGVPEPGSVKVDPETHTLKRESAELILNPPDRDAIQMALELKKNYDAEVTAISMGPPNVIPILKRIYAQGIDKLILLSDRAFAGADTLATSYVLAKAIRKISDFSVVLMGLHSIDGETAQVPPETAAILGIPSVTNVKRIWKEEEKKWIVLREHEYGEEEVEIEAPFVASIAKEAFDYYTPPSLKRLLKLKEIEPEVWSASDLEAEPDKLGLKGSPTQVLDVFERKIETTGKIIEAEPEELVEELIKVLKQKEIIKEV
ncbi:MAG: electron transfer flavoprotein subunit beta/FixA family protein [Thermodesulfobacteria bacterium]|nr:electron transfer flavoprotein subunit beta/FixA family protein [Thermodesulfobacteriota bacterium]